MDWTVRLVVAVAVAAALAAPAVAAPKSKPKLEVTRVADPPTTASAGAEIPASGRVANEGEKAATATVRVSLRRGEEAGPGGIRLGKVRAGVVEPGDSERFRGAAEIPGDTPIGDFRISACVRKRGKEGAWRCALALERIAVTGPPTSPPDDGGPTDPPPETDPPSPPAGEFTPGARSAGDPLFPAIGNGGYDVQHYDVALDYDPIANAFDSARTTIAAEATQNLSELSFDMQGMNVAGVAVDGTAAQFDRAGTKLVIDPAGQGIPNGQDFTVGVDYSGTPQEITDPDGSKEGWIRASGGVADGGFVVNEPIGAQGWFPNNNYPTDKATYDFRVTVPLTHTALGNGELIAATNNGDGTRTWHWRMSDPMSTYLTTATVGVFDFTESQITHTTPNPDRIIPEHRAVDVAYTPLQEAAIDTELDQVAPMTDFLGGIYGPYPFDSTGGVVDVAPGVGYALEVQTKPHYATPLTTASRSTVLHEIAHQWFGNEVTLASWSDIWFNEGWATWSEWYWGDLENGDVTPEEQWDAEFAAASEEDWEVAPAVLDGDPANLFAHFPVYVRSAMTLQGYREITDHATFLELADRIQSDFGGSHISTRQFIDLALEVSGFTGAERDRLAEYFDQWLYGESEPEITPDNFDTP